MKCSWDDCEEEATVFFGRNKIPYCVPHLKESVERQKELCRESCARDLMMLEYMMEEALKNQEERQEVENETDA